MPKSKRPADQNQLAKALVDQLTGSLEKEDTSKNPAAVALGRLGGLRGGRARAEKLSAKARKAIASKAARARWNRS